jgi:hypothetical protein
MDWASCSRSYPTLHMQPAHFVYCMYLRLYSSMLAIAGTIWDDIVFSFSFLSSLPACNTSKFDFGRKPRNSKPDTSVSIASLWICSVELRLLELAMAFVAPTLSYAIYILRNDVVDGECYPIRLGASRSYSFPPSYPCSLTRGYLPLDSCLYKM